MHAVAAAAVLGMQDAFDGDVAAAKEEVVGRTLGASWGTGPYSPSSSKPG